MGIWSMEAQEKSSIFLKIKQWRTHSLCNGTKETKNKTSRLPVQDFLIHQNRLNVF